MVVEYLDVIIVIDIYVCAQLNNGMISMIPVGWYVTSVKTNNGLQQVDILGMMTLGV